MTSSSSVVTEVVQLQFLVEPADYLGLFDQLEVWRSRSTVSAAYEELTAPTWAVARLPRSATDAPVSPVTGASVVIVGKKLELLVDEEDSVTVTFTSSDPLTFATCATQITAQGQNKVRSYVAADGTLVVETTLPGTGAQLRALPSDGAVLLGLPTAEPDSFAFGRTARLVLSADQTLYTFSDLRGAQSYFYKTRFRNKNTGAVSTFSAPVSVGALTGVSAANVALGEVRLVSLSGRPLSNVAVSVYNAFRGVLIEDRLVVEGQVTQMTNQDGYAAFSLVRGTRVTVAVAGTSIVRDVTVPTDPAVLSFSLLGPIGANDVFQVQVPDLAYAPKYSL